MPPDRRPPPASAVLALQRAAHATLQVLAIELAELELTASEINVLANLSDGPRRTVSQLGAAVGSRPTTLTGVLDRLERRGYIVRVAHATDRRAVGVALTPTGQEAAEWIRRAVADLETLRLNAVAPEQVAAFHHVLRALTGSPDGS